jgi:hypothetical protein
MLVFEDIQKITERRSNQGIVDDLPSADMAYYAMEQK